MADDKKYRILSLDGGGIRGIITAVWLAALEEQLGGGKLSDHFDLIAGTSTGSILACAIAHGMGPQAIVELYREKGREIFPGRAARLWNRAGRLLKEGPSGPKYSDAGLQKVLSETFRKRNNTPLLLENLKTNVIVVSYDTLRRRAVVFKSFRPEHKKLSVVDVVKSSCSAPTYFPSHVFKFEGVQTPMIDGGVVANNPAACAIAEGIRLNREKKTDGCQLQDFVVASFGTGEATRPITAEDSQEWGALEWAVPIVDVLFDGSSDATDYIARFLIEESQYFRFQTRLIRGYDDMDNADETNLDALVGLAQNFLSGTEGRRLLSSLAVTLRGSG